MHPLEIPSEPALSSAFDSPHECPPLPVSTPTRIVERVTPTSCIIIDVDSIILQNFNNIHFVLAFNNAVANYIEYACKLNNIVQCCDFPMKINFSLAR